MCWQVVQASTTSIMLGLVRFLDQTIRTQGTVQHKRSDNILIDKSNRKLNLLGNDERCKFVFLSRKEKTKAEKYQDLVFYASITWRKKLCLLWLMHLMLKTLHIKEIVVQLMVAALLETISSTLSLLIL